MHNLHRFYVFLLNVRLNPLLICISLSSLHSVYSVASSDIIFIQIRSPVVEGKATLFASQFIKLLESLSLSSITFLCGSSLQGQADNIVRRFFQPSNII